MFMASRYPTTQVVDYCYHPVHIVKDGRDLFVPCGKCNGCRLHRSNEWAMRIGNEIEVTPFTIFFTATYSNMCIPTLKRVLDKNGFPAYTWKHDRNFRFDGVKYKLRDEKDFPEFFYSDEYMPITNFYDPNKEYICYTSKRDVQLWLKMLRKNINEHYGRTTEETTFRSYIISEYGPTTFRCHLHGLIFPRSQDLAEYLTEYALYETWKMCDKDEFQLHYCDSGARGYVSNYTTRYSRLPNIYKDNKELAPFRLSSKSPAIGYVETKNEEIFENVSIGVIEYNKEITRLGTSSSYVYPKDYMARLFPKPYRYSQISFPAVLSIAERLYRADRETRYGFSEISSWLRAFSHPMNYNLQLQCYRICEKYGMSPFHYCYLMDTYYYKKDMMSLKMQYEYMQKVLSSDDVEKKRTFLTDYFVNTFSYLSSNINQYGLYDYNISLFLESFGFSCDISPYYFLKPYQPDANYVAEVEDLVDNMEKMPKYNVDKAIKENGISYI